MYFINRLHFPHLDKGLPVAACFKCVGARTGERIHQYDSAERQTARESMLRHSSPFLHPPSLPPFFKYQRAERRLKQGVHQVDVLRKVPELGFKVFERMVHDALHVRLLCVHVCRKENKDRYTPKQLLTFDRSFCKNKKNKCKQNRSLPLSPPPDYVPVPWQ